MHPIVLIPCMLIVILCAYLLRGVIHEGRRRLQSRRRRDGLLRWLAD